MSYFMGINEFMKNNTNNWIEFKAEYRCPTCQNQFDSEMTEGFCPRCRTKSTETIVKIKFDRKKFRQQIRSFKKYRRKGL